ARMLIEEIGGKGDAVARAAAEQVASGFIQSLADSVETSDFDRSKRARVAIHRVLAGHVPRLRTIASSFFIRLLFEIHPEARQLEYVHSDEALPSRLQKP